MEIRTIEEYLKDDHGEAWEYDGKLKVVPYDYAKELAIEFAKQFVDLAAEKVWDISYSTEKWYNKQSILDIKQLIK